MVVRDDDDGLAGVDEPVEQAEQLLDVGEVEAGGFGISTLAFLEVVHARAMHADQIVAVGDVQQRRVRVLVTRERLVPTDDPAWGGGPVTSSVLSSPLSSRARRSFSPPRR